MKKLPIHRYEVTSTKIKSFRKHNIKIVKQREMHLTKKTTTHRHEQKKQTKTTIDLFFILVKSFFYTGFESIRPT